MAQKKRFCLIIICGLVLCLCQTDLSAAIKDEFKKFPPVSGEIYGQATAGVKSITVNGKPVSFDANQNFRAFIKLKAGEKYLVLRINYEGLRIVKKYLILRRSPISKFKVFVPKEKIEKTGLEAKQAALEAKRKKLLALKAGEKAKAEEKAKTKEKEEKLWMQKVSSPNFYPNEFKESSVIKALNQAISSDRYGIPFKSQENTIERLNEILQVPNFYEITRVKGKHLTFTPRIKSLIEETKDYRWKSFSQLTDFQKKKIMFLNRLLLEALYSQAPKRETWLVAQPAKPKPAVPSARITEYLYVWEFSSGKLMLVKEWKGNYSAEINIPISKQWLDLKGLSEKDLKELIEKPAAAFKPKKK